MKTRFFIILSLFVFCTFLPKFVSHADAVKTDACVNKTTGAVRLLLSGSCTASENPIALNIAGNQGPVGPKGPTGPKGDQGQKGQQGAVGAKGPTGPKGSQGPAGLTWKGPWSNTTGYAVNDVVNFNGSAYICIAGNNNAQPDSHAADWKLLVQKGDQGAVGLQGIQGLAGPTGPQGPQGSAGIAGVTGAAGPQGPTGPQGAKGDTGHKGDTGNKGDTGAIGPTGPTGIQGPQGLPGAIANVKVYDNNNQFIGSLIQYQPGGTGRTLNSCFVFIPGLNKVAHLLISDDGKGYSIAGDALAFASHGCSGSAYTNDDQNYLFLGVNGIYYTSGALVSFISPTSSDKITFRSSLGPYSTTCMECTDNDNNLSDCVEDSTNNMIAAFYEAIEVSVVDIPFTLPLAAPLHFQMD